MVYSASNITATVPGMTGQSSAVAQKIAGGVDNSSDQAMTFADFILARVTALQSTQDELDQIANKTTGETGKLLSPSDSALLTIAEFLNPTDEKNADFNLKLEDLTSEDKQALKELSSNILQLEEDGKIELSDEQIKALTALRDLMANPEIDVTAVSEDDDNDNTIIIDHGGKKIIIPVVLTKLFANPNSDLPEEAMDNNAVINRIVANLEKIAAALTQGKADTDNTPPSEEELAAAMNAIEPSDQGDEKTIQNTAEKDNSLLTAQTVATQTATDDGLLEDNTNNNGTHKNNESDTDNDGAVAAVTVPQPTTQTRESGFETDVVNTLANKNVLPQNNTGSHNNMDFSNNPDANEDTDTAILTAAAKQSKTATKTDTVTATSKTSFSAMLNGNATAAGNTATDITDSDFSDDSLETLKTADTLIQGDAKTALLKGTTAWTRTTATPAAQQVSMQVYKAAVKGDTRITIKLHPEELGKVDVKLEMTKDGKAKATVFADNSDTLNMLSRNAAQLQKALNDAGLQAQSGDLSFHLNDGNSNNAQTSANNQNGHGASGSAIHNDNNSIETEIALPPEAIIGEYSVNYKV